MMTPETNRCTLDVHDLDAFYDQLWNQASHGAQDDVEQSRRQVILRLMEEYVLPSFGVENSLRILDLGCGRGWLTNILSHYGYAVGIDPVQSAIKRARESFPALEFRVGIAKDFFRMNEGTDQFELIVSTEVIEHIVDDEKQDFLTNIHSLLVPRGFAILTTPRGELWTAWKRLGIKEQPIEQWIGEASLDQLSRSVGFQVVAKDRAFLPKFSYNWISHLATSRFLRLLMKHFPRSRLLAKLRYYCGIYQVILLRKCAELINGLS